MKILFVSRIKNGKANPFVHEQGEALKKYHNHDIKHYLIEKGGLSGYLSSSLEILKIYRDKTLPWCSPLIIINKISHSVN